MKPAAALVCAALLVLGSPAAAADFTFTGPIAVPATGNGGAAAPFPVTFAVTGLGLVTDVNLTLTGLSHSWSDDLQIALESPTGTRVLLMNDAGGSANWSAATLVFDQQAAATINNTALLYGGNNGIIPGGSYRPSNYSVGLVNFLIDGEDLGLFNGEAANGSWKLYVRDNGLLANSGSIASATLSVLATPVPEPASWALMIAGFGLAGAVLRRRHALGMPTTCS